MTPNPNLRISERRAARRLAAKAMQVVRELREARGGHTFPGLEAWARSLDEPSRGGHRCPMPGCRRGVQRGSDRCHVHWWATRDMQDHLTNGRWAVFDAAGKQVFGPASRNRAWSWARGMYEGDDWKHRLGIGPAPRPYSLGELMRENERLAASVLLKAWTPVPNPDNPVAPAAPPTLWPGPFPNPEGWNKQRIE